MKNEVAKVIGGGVTTPTRSPIYAWFWQHHAEILPKLTGVRVRWAAIAERLAELGVTDAAGGKPQAQTVRRAWWQVRRDKEATRERARAKRAQPVHPDPVPIPGEVAPGVRLLNSDARAPAPIPDEPGPRETVAPVKQRLALKPAKPRLPPTEGA